MAHKKKPPIVVEALLIFSRHFQGGEDADNALQYPAYRREKSRTPRQAEGSFKRIAPAVYDDGNPIQFFVQRLPGTITLTKLGEGTFR